MTTPTTADCPYCLDGFTPAGIHPVLGPVVKACPVSEPCACCRNEGRFPVDFHCFGCFLAFCADQGLMPVLCHTCLGVTDTVPIPIEEAG